jgi:hypothetical protein
MYSSFKLEIIIALIDKENLGYKGKGYRLSYIENDYKV